MNARADMLGFGEPVYLWLLVIPAALLGIWVWDALRRRLDARRAGHAQVVPALSTVEEPVRRARYSNIGTLPFWLCVLTAASLCVAALARPYIRVWRPGTAGIDFVILQDASASMYVRDVAPDRWVRSMQFLRAFADTLSWEQDRVGMALFAYFVAPQLRLTRDPNALFFFLDHLGEQSPFRLQDDPTWNTNIEDGIQWGLRLIETHEELFGRTNNPKAFVVISDGQSWSGKVETALTAARSAGVSIHVVGVGTSIGGFIPEAGESGRPSRIHSELDRESLRAIARAGNGEYLELGVLSDRDIASRIITSVRRRAPLAPQEERREELYGRFLVAALLVLLPGTLALRNTTELWLQAAGALAGVLILARLVT